MKVGDLVEWRLDGDVGIVVRRLRSAPKVQVYWSNGELEWMWEKQDGLKLVLKVLS